MEQLASIIKSREVIMHSRNCSTDSSLIPTSFRSSFSLGNFPTLNQKIEFFVNNFYLNRSIKCLKLISSLYQLVQQVI